ncbi:hypothetical protein BHE74_00044743 [Ensete ventricosum]|nr:hypothetical protein GW17_00011351 [Ensete ventricosum]RWW49130.1 hypothetical protein BHE74_00044743 [Ensete ventricosum]
MLSARSLSRSDEELRIVRSYLKLMCVDQYDVRHSMVFWSIFLLLGVFIPTASYFVHSCAFYYFIRDY